MSDWGRHKTKAWLVPIIVAMILTPLLTAVSGAEMASANGEKLAIIAEQVSASSYQPNTNYVAANVVDGNLDIESRWSAQGEGEWIQLDLLEPRTVTWLQIAFVSAESRATIFEVQVSNDGEQFTTVLDRTNSSNIVGLQPFVIPEPASARYMRIVGYGNTSNLWNSYIEVELYEGVPPEIEEPQGPGEPGDYNEEELQPEHELISVSDAAGLNAALASAEAGTIIELQNGAYTQEGPFVIEGKHGTPAEPIVIRAAELGKASLSGAAYLIIRDSSYIQVEGLQFVNAIGPSAEAPNPGLVLENASHISVLSNRFALDESEQNEAAQSHYLIVNGVGSHNRIAYNEFGPKSKIGAMVAYNGNGEVISQYDIIEHNWFHHTGPRISNGLEAIRLGYSGLSLSSGFIKIQYNLFESADGDPEIVSVKASDNIVRYNTFLNSQGQITSRHGHRNSFYGNFFLNTEQKSGVGGIRIYGNDHEIYNNYMEGLTFNAIHIDGGTYDAGSDGTGASLIYNAGSKDTPELAEINLNELKAEDPDAWLAVMRGHWRAYNAKVYNNTIVSSTSGIIDGGRTFASENSLVANNLIYNNFGRMFEQLSNSRNCERDRGDSWMYTPGKCMTYVGNMAFGHAEVHHNQVPKTDEQIRYMDPLLIRGSEGLIRLSSVSPARDQAIQQYSAETDMDGQLRHATDIGADEYSLLEKENRPLTQEDVGPYAAAERKKGLSALSLSTGLLSEPFSTDQLLYTVTLSNSIHELGVAPTAYADDAEITVSLNGSTSETVVSGTESRGLALIQGNSLNILQIHVTEAGESITYTILIKRPTGN